MSKVLRGAVIGCGFFSRHHFEAWRRIAGVQVIAACDLNIDRARKYSDKVYSLPEVLFANERLDFVDIVTQAESHLSLARLAEHYGVAVICQKPIAPDWPSALQLVELMERRPIPFMVHENWRWQPWHREIHTRIQNGDIGQPISYGFRTRHNDGGGSEPYPMQAYFRTLPRLLIYETLIHHLDTAAFLFGDISDIYADIFRKNPNIRAEDSAIICVNHATGVRGWVDGHRFLESIPNGPAMGEAYFEGDEGYLLLLANGDLYRNNQLVWQNKITSGYRGDSVRATQAHFIKCLQTNEPFESSGRAYLKTTAAMEASYLSAQQHRRVDLAEIFAAQEVSWIS